MPSHKPGAQVLDLQAMRDSAWQDTLALEQAVIGYCEGHTAKACPSWAAENLRNSAQRLIGKANAIARAHANRQSYG